VPVIDLRFDLRPNKAETFTQPKRPYLRNVRKFKVYSRKSLESLVQALAEATADSYLEIRSYTGWADRLMRSRRQPEQVHPVVLDLRQPQLRHGGDHLPILRRQRVMHLRGQAGEGVRGE
jgi:hypothetical protein